jgi:hypothetical protein
VSIFFRGPVRMNFWMGLDDILEPTHVTAEDLAAHWDALWWCSLAPPTLLLGHYAAWHCYAYLRGTSSGPARRALPCPPVPLSISPHAHRRATGMSPAATLPLALWRAHILPFLPISVVANVACTSRPLYSLCNAYDKYLTAKVSALGNCDTGTFIRDTDLFARWFAHRKGCPEAKAQLLLIVRRSYEDQRKRLLASSRDLTARRLPTVALVGLLSITRRSYLNPAADFRGAVAFNLCTVLTSGIWVPFVRKRWPRQTLVVANYAFLFSVFMHLMHASHRCLDPQPLMDPNATPHPVAIVFCVGAAFSFGFCFLYCAMYEVMQYLEPALPLSRALAFLTEFILRRSLPLTSLRRLYRRLCPSFHKPSDPLCDH